MHHRILTTVRFAVALAMGCCAWGSSVAGSSSAQAAESNDAAIGALQASLVKNIGHSRDWLDQADYKSLVAQLPAEQSVGFRGKDGKFAGVPVTELSADQKEQLQKTVKLVFEPYRNADRDEVNDCLKKQGGLDACSLAYYAQGDIGDDGVWDNWRLEGPSFVFYFRGSPHVHMWVNVGSDPAVKLNA